MVALGQQVRQLAHVFGVLGEKLVDARVLHDDELALYRAHGLVGYQPAGAEAGAVHHDARGLGGLGQRVEPAGPHRDAGLVELLEQVGQVPRHVHHRHRVPPPAGEAGRQVDCGKALEVRDLQRPAGWLGHFAAGLHAGHEVHAGFRLGREALQPLPGVPAPFVGTVVLRRQVRAPDGARAGGGGQFRWCVGKHPHRRAR